MKGIGKYDEVSMALQAALQAEGVLIIVVNGMRGTGTSCTGSPGARQTIADIFETVLLPQMRAEAVELQKRDDEAKKRADWRPDCTF
jgi:hypothetical protein